jgi:hypothetical protein
MKVEILEKVGEITVTQLRPAEENRVIADTEAKRKAELARIEEERRESEAKKRAVELLPTICEAINKKAEKGDTSLTLTWLKKQSNPYGISWVNWLECSKYILPIFEQMGYKHYEHCYSDSWVKRSGKNGYIIFYW